MGLDMYLHKKIFLWDNDRKSLKIEGLKSRINPEKVCYIIEDAGYWRKANAIHQWFVDNVQNGEDDCKTYYVGREELIRLLETVNQVIDSCELVEGDIANGYTFENGVKKPILEKGKYIKDTTVAEELLPTTEGCFFGGTNYDQYYYEQLQDTKKILEEALSDKSGDFEYHAIW